MKTRGNRKRRDGLRPTIELMEARQVLSAILMSGDSVSLRTRRDYELASPQGIAPVTAVPIGRSEDAAFKVVEIKGNGDGRIQEGERVAFKTQRGMTINCLDSRGVLRPIGFSDETNDASDELFTIRKAVPDGDPNIHDGDSVLIVTRYGYFWNSFDSRGDAQAIPVANSTPGASDEIFTVALRDPSTLVRTPVDSPFVMGRPVSLAPTNLPNYYVHDGGSGTYADPFAEGETYANDATFIPRPGLADPSLVSFESAIHPGRFLRHRGFEFYLDPNDGSDLFKNDATFRVGTAFGGGGVTLESYNFPGRFVRHRYLRLRLDPQDGGDQLRLDSVFAVKPALAAAANTLPAITDPAPSQPVVLGDPPPPPAVAKSLPAISLGALNWDASTTYRGFMIGSKTLLDPSLRAKAVAELQSWNVNLLRLELPLVSSRSFLDQAKEIAASVAGVVPELARAGISVILSFHPTEAGAPMHAQLVDSKAARASFIQAWELLARTFGKQKGVAGYDLLNEPDAVLARVWSGLVKDTAAAIRRVDTEKAIIVEPIGGNPEQIDKLPIFDPKLRVVYSFHMYGPLRYTHQGVLDRYPLGVKLSDPSKSANTPGLTIRQVAEKTLDDVRKWQIRNKTRIYVGEFSVNRAVPDASEYLKLCIDRFRRYGWNWTYHAYSTDAFAKTAEESDFWNIKLGPAGNNGLRTLKQGLLG